MATTYDLIATTTLASAAGTISFSGWDSSYTELEIIGTVKFGGDSDITLRFNSDANSNYFSRCQGYSSTTGGYVGSQSQNAGTAVNLNYSSIINGTTYFHPLCLTFNDVQSTATCKTVNGLFGTVITTGAQILQVGASYFGSNQTLTSINLLASANFAIGTSLSLYGYKRGNA
jgi:hypothetical protein